MKWAVSVAQQSIRLSREDEQIGMRHRLRVSSKRRVQRRRYGATNAFDSPLRSIISFEEVQR